MSQVNDFIHKMKNCPEGTAGWKTFEDLCVEILRYLFIPPLNEPIIQPRSYSGIDRRDAVFPNRNHGATNNWAKLLIELNARLILFEFKNYDKQEIGKEEVVQTQSYMKEPMGRLAIMLCNKFPDKSAHQKRNTIYSKDRQIILFLTKDDLKEMLFIKERREDPSDFILDKIERFYLQHE